MERCDEVPSEKLKHRLGDQWSTGEPITFLTVLNPFSGEPVAEVPVGGQADVSAAVAAAARAATWWGELAPAERGDQLRAAGARVAAGIDDLIRLEAIEMGKPVSAAREWTLGSTGAFAEMAEVAEGFLSQALGDDGSAQLRVPYGVAGLIVPWNFPVMMAIGQLAGLIAAGNTVVYKPSERSPKSAVRLVELVDLPAGVVNLVLGDGRTGAELDVTEGSEWCRLLGPSQPAETSRGRAASCSGPRSSSWAGKTPSSWTLASTRLGRPSS